jgi:hypothetical protein
MLQLISAFVGQAMQPMQVQTVQPQQQQTNPAIVAVVALGGIIIVGGLLYVALKD